MNDNNDFGLAHLSTLHQSLLAEVADERARLDSLTQANALARKLRHTQLLRTAHANEMLTALQRKTHETQFNADCIAERREFICIQTFLI